MTFSANATTPNFNYSSGSGSNSTSPFIEVFMNRDPTSNDVSYPVKQRWLNTISVREWILTGFNNSTGILLAIWIQLDDGDALTQIGLPAPSGNGVTVTPDLNGLINFTSTAQHYHL